MKSRLRLAFALRPELGVETLALLASMFFSLACNRAFFHGVVASGTLHGASGWITMASLFVALTALNMLLLGLVLNRWTAKPVLVVLLLVTAAAVHFMDHYGVYFDTDMLRNVLHTDRRESGELMSVGMIAALLLQGVLPTLLVSRVRLKPRRWQRALLVRATTLVLALLVAAGALLLSFQPIAALMRNQPELRHLVTPGNYLVSLGRVLLEDSGPEPPRSPVGADATVATRAAQAKPRLLVLVVGETVRAQNWGLDGYARDTTPQLARLHPINYPDVSACGSSTEVSLPCMFSPYGRADYDRRRIRGSESLLHVLEHAGIATLWRDNQGGCKGVCDGLAFESSEHATRAQHPASCDERRCLDEVMLDGLAQIVDGRRGDLVVVLHQLGNHGPSYFQRYPPRLRRYTPTCDTPVLGDCTTQEVVNAYDNAVLYTDDFLARTIRWLVARPDRETALIYLSDHGESLGENGLFLHGMPYAIAPETQTRVPMVMWLSPGFAAARGIDVGCLRRHASEPASQDNLFHTVLGLMEVDTVALQADKDLIAPCIAAGHQDVAPSAPSSS